MDPAIVSTGIATAVLTALLFLTGSRSGMLSLVAAIVIMVVMVRSRISRGTAVVGAATLVAACTLVVLFGGLAFVVGRAEPTVREGGGGRITIWRETVPVVRDFWAFGTGIGTYGRAMALYQQTDRHLHFNQAHNHYLQVAAEGGLLVGVPVAIGAVLFAGMAVRRLREEDTPFFWIRSGASAAVLAVALQSVWETGLRMPANAVLFAVVCALAVHPPRRRSSRGH